MLGSSCVAAQLAASQEGLSSMSELLLCSPLDLGRIFSFLILYAVGRTPWAGDQPVARPLPTHRTIQTQHKSTQTSTSRTGFEPLIPVFERAVTVIGNDFVLVD
jgi:hypothetical protein